MTFHIVIIIAYPIEYSHIDDHMGTDCALCFYYNNYPEPHFHISICHENLQITKLT